MPLRQRQPKRGPRRKTNHAARKGGGWRTRHQQVRRARAHEAQSNVNKRHDNKTTSSNNKRAQTREPTADQGPRARATGTTRQARCEAAAQTNHTEPRNLEANLHAMRSKTISSTVEAYDSSGGHAPGGRRAAPIGTMATRPSRATGGNNLTTDAPSRVTINQRRNNETARHMTT